MMTIELKDGEAVVIFRPNGEAQAILAQVPGVHPPNIAADMAVVLFDHNDLIDLLAERMGLVVKQ